MFPTPFNDEQRLKALASYDVLDTPPEKVFDSLTRLACRQFNAPIALVSLVDEARQWFKSSQGLDAKETARELAFCAHAILTDAPLVVLDATTDDRFSTNPLVCGDLGIRFYAGAPLITGEGFRLGTFCVIDVEPRQQFLGDDIAALKEFADTAMQILELRRQARQPKKSDDEARIAEDARVELFSTVAHEIRSPLATLFSMAQLVESKIFGPMGDPRYEEFSVLISKSAEQIMSVADRMLDFARLKTGEVDIKDSRFSVREVLERARRGAMPMGQHGGPTVLVAPLAVDFLLIADRVYVIQMLTNLIANAIKYSDRDPQIQVSAALGQDGILSICVSDSGIGMSDEGIAQAIRPFGRIKQVGRADAGGLGIGLPLVKRLIELHGGKLVIESVEGKGTKASLLFPPYRVAKMNQITKIAV